MPIMDKKSGVMYQVFASTICFSFVYLWHGLKPRILIWSVLNYIGILIETIGGALWKNESYQKMETSFLSPRGQRRLHAAVAGT